MSRPVEHSTAGGPMEVDGAELERVRILSALFDGPADRETKLRLRWVIGYRELVEIIEGPGATAIPADQSRPSAPRDGLADSDEAVEALVEARMARYYPHTEWADCSAEFRSSFLVDVRADLAAVAPFVAARVRDEAVADERRNAVAQVRHDLALLADRVEDYTAQGLRDRLSLYADQLSRSLAAGSVPVATPAEAARCEHGSEFAHQWLTGRSLRRCPGPAAAPSVGTGTPAEAVSGGSGHAERQGPTIACPVVGCSGDQCVLCGGAMRLPVGPETDAALAALCADMQREYDATYERMAAERDRLTAEVARYRAAIEAALAVLRPALDLNASSYTARRLRLNTAISALATALGDGA